MTCFSCEWYRYGQTPYCAKARSGFPGIGRACRAFSYEPGADEAEATHNPEQK